MVILADNEVRHRDFPCSKRLSLQLLARLHSNLINLWFIKVDRGTDPSFHVFVLIKCSSLVLVDEGSLIQTLHEFRLVLGICEPDLFSMLLLLIRVINLDVPLIDLFW